MNMAAPRMILAGNPDELAQAYCFYHKYGFSVSQLLTENEEQARLLAGRYPVPARTFAAWSQHQKPASGERLVIASSDLRFRGQVSGWYTQQERPETVPVMHACLYSPAVEEVVDALSYNDTQTPNRYIEALVAEYPESGADPICCLASALSRRIRGEIDPDRPTLGVLYEYAEYRSNLGSDAMYARLREAGYNVVFLYGTLCDDAYEQRPWSYYVGHGLARHLEWLDAVFIYFRTPTPPRGVKLIFLNHDIYHDPHQPDEATWLKDYARLRFSPDQVEPDYVCVPCASMMDWRLMDVRKPAYLLPTGYFKLDINIRRCREAARTPDSLLYAPTGVEYYGRQLSQVSLPRHGVAILAALLDNFPDYRVIFRPHPNTYHTPYVAEICRRFEGDPRFVYDQDPSQYIESYSRSALMVSDMAGTAYTFAFSTLRPVVFFSHEEGYIQKNYDHSLFYRNRERVGLVAVSIAALVQGVRQLLAEGELRNEAIRLFRDAEMYNVGRTEDEFVETLQRILQGGRSPVWRWVVPSVFGLEPNPIAGSPPELIAEGYKGFNIVRFRGRIFGLAQSLGPMELGPLLDRGGSAVEALVGRGDCVLGASREEVVRGIDALSTPTVPVLVEQAFLGFNIVQYGDVFVGLAQRLGPVDLATVEEATLRNYQQAGLCIVGSSAAEVRARVSQQDRQS